MCIDIRYSSPKVNFIEVPHANNCLQENFGAYSVVESIQGTLTAEQLANSTANDQ